MQINDKTEISEQSLLTIAIPTYNRASYLQLCLQHISSELDRLNAPMRHLVKLYISVNASTDHTAEVITTFLRNYADTCEVVTNSENIGGERNVAQCYTAANTPYVWVLGDDDVLLAGGLAKVLDVLRQYDLDILRVGCKPYIDSPNENKKKLLGRSHKTGLQLFSDAKAFTRLIHVNLTFISGLIVRTGYDCPASKSIVKDSNLPQMSWVSTLLCNGHSFAILNDVVIAAKTDNSGGFSLIQVFGINLQKISKILFKEKPALIRIIQNGAIVVFFPSVFMALRNNQGNYVTENDVLGSLKALYGKNWRYYLFIAPLFMLPKVIAKIYYFFIRVVHRFLLSFIV